jgi:hypothetical protein
MEPALWELNEGNENEEVGVIIRLHQPDTLPPHVRLITQFGAIATVRLPRGAIVDIRQDEAVASMKAPDLLTPGDEVPIDAEAFHAPSSASDNRRPLHHDGSTLVEQGFDAIVTTQPGRAIVQSTGNYFDRSAHSSGRVPPGQIITIPFVVSPADVTPNELEIWYPGRDIFTIAVRSPNGTMSKQTGLDDQSSIQVNGQAVCKVYHRAREPNNLDNNCHVYMENGAPPGRWELILTGIDVVDGRFNIWIERDATCPDCQSRFEQSFVVPLSTTGTICNGLRTIAVGAYNAHNPMRSLGPFSSSGPTRDGRRKPNLIAPGVQILAARSGLHRSNRSANFLVRKSGTSMAAPHVTGAVALMFDLANRVGHKLAIHDTLNLLLGSTTAVEAEGDETYRIGSGMLDTDAALEATGDFLDKQFLDKPFDMPVPSEISNLPDASKRSIMKPNLTEIDASETTWESDWLETIESEIQSQIPVQTHFNRILQRSGLQTISSLRDLFMMFGRPSTANCKYIG